MVAHTLRLRTRRAIFAALTPGRLVRVDPQRSAPSPRFKEPGMSISTPERLSPHSTEPADRTSHDSAHDPSQRRSFPGWRWVAVWAAFPVAGYIGWKVGGRVDAVDAALVGGALTGAGIGAAQWWAAKGALGRAAAWIGASAVGYAVGLAAGAALVGYDTDLGALAVRGLVSG